MQKEWMLRQPRNHYQYFLNSSGSTKLGQQNSGHHVGTIFDSVDSSRDMAMLRMNRQPRPSTKPIGTNGELSESIALHQRKLRDTEARIDHALDLVTRSFGVNQSAGLTRHNLPQTPEVRKIRETLNKTQRVPSVDPMRQEPRFEDPSMMRTHKSPITIVKKRRESSVIKQKIKPNSSPTIRVYKTSPVIVPYVPPPPKKTLSKEKIDRTQTLQISVNMGNTHVYEAASPNFVNTFANMKTFNAMDQSNPAGLQRFHTSIDMGGFTDNEISFQCNGKKIIITGNRIKKIYTNARKVTEVLELPTGVFPEKLRIARDHDGVLHISERWAC